MTSKKLLSSKRFRLALSLLICLHLLAVFLPPLSFQTRGPLGQSPSVSSALRPLEGYGEFLYINRGYAFFAPDPGPSHLIQAAITDSQGNRTEVMIPDRKVHWPRLLYHRHFMLTEFLYEIYEPALSPAAVAALEPQEAELWRQSRSRYEHFRQSLVQHLEFANPNSEVAIRRIEHLIPDLVEFQRQPVNLTDPESYRVLLDQPIDFAQPPMPGEVEQLPEATPVLPPSEPAADGANSGAEP